MAFLASVSVDRATIIEPVSVDRNRSALAELSRLNRVGGIAAGIAWTYRGFWVVIAPIRDQGPIFTIGDAGGSPDAVLVAASNYLWPATSQHWPVVDLEASLSSYDRWVRVLDRPLSAVYPSPPSLLRNAIFDHVKQFPDKLGVDKVPNIIHAIEDNSAWQAASGEYNRAQL